MTTQLLLPLAALLGAFVGALVGVLLASRTQRRADRPGNCEPEPVDEWTAAEIERAAAIWAESKGMPDQAADLMADKLRLLHRLALRRNQR
jgi:hypothetical protein